MKKLLIAMFAAALAGGCQDQNKNLDPTLDGFFVDTDAQTPIATRFADAQAASGARADATLSRQHFDGPALNSLGQAKLALMLKDDDAASPMKVYLNTGEKDPAYKQREQSVAAFLKDKGLRDTQIELVAGPNPESTSPAARHLANLPKTDTSSASGDAGKSAAAGGSGGTSGADQGLAGAAGGSGAGATH